jgi:hypothetical protein
MVLLNTFIIAIPPGKYKVVLFNNIPEEEEREDFSCFFSNEEKVTGILDFLPFPQRNSLPMKII